MRSGSEAAAAVLFELALYGWNVASDTGTAPSPRLRASMVTSRNHASPTPSPL